MTAENTRIWKEIFREQEEQEDFLRFRNPSFSYWYNWLVAACVVALFASFVWWAIDIHTRNAADQARAELLAQMDAEHAEMIAAAEAQEAERKAAAESLQIKEAQAVARAFFGIRNFVEKYKYDNSELATYARCMFNRSETRGKSVEEILAEPGQFIAYTDKNNLVKEYYDLALQLVADWHDGNLKECDAQKFQTAIFTPQGIWLIDDSRKEVPDRWHA